MKRFVIKCLQRTLQNLPSFLDSCPPHLAPSDAEDSGCDNIDPSPADGDNDPNISNYLPLVDDVAESATLSSGSAKKRKAVRKTEKEQARLKLLM